MITFEHFKKDKNFYKIIFKFLGHIFLSVFLLIFFIPFFLIKKITFKKKKTICIIKDFYRNKKRKAKLKYDADITLKHYLKSNNKYYKVITFYPDLNQNKVLPFKFLKFFFSSQPTLIFVPTDYSNYFYDLNYILFIFLKFFFNLKIVGISNDPIWSLNFLRYRLGLLFFNAQIAWPYLYTKKKHFPAPQNILFKESLYKKKILTSIKKTIDICYIGRKYGNRETILKFLNIRGIKVKKFGLGYNKQLSSKNFYKILNNSKIVINFSRNVKSLKRYTIYPFTNRGRIFEATIAGCLMFDERNKDIEIFFRPFKEYIPYKTKEELYIKIKYYLKNFNNIGYKIIRNAQMKNSTLYSSNNFWDKLLKELDI